MFSITQCLYITDFYENQCVNTATYKLRVLNCYDAAIMLYYSVTFHTTDHTAVMLP
jgi:hypothetical protein